jgi:mannosyl-3-phosphoglycerate phosphatase
VPHPAKMIHMLIFFTDLDGTLLERNTYSAEPAREALARISRLGFPLVFCTSKTRAEVEHWRTILSNSHPFIAENGGALFVPDGYFEKPFQAPTYRHGYAVFEFGTPYADLVGILGQASQLSGCRVRGFNEMSAEELSLRCGMSLEQARLAKLREYDEPFEILDPPGDRLLKAITACGKTWTRGGRFHHVTGANNKAHGICLLTSYYCHAFGNITTVGLGDGLNDLDFLRFMNIPVIIQSPGDQRLRSSLQSARISEFPGPAGWNASVIEILNEQASESHSLLTKTAAVAG